jgi:hypothetical protein
MPADRRQPPRGADHVLGNSGPTLQMALARRRPVINFVYPTYKGLQTLPAKAEAVPSGYADPIRLTSVTRRPGWGPGSPR